ncbi:MAG: hypothetical protein LBE59_01070 [Nevskiaceae bacterium]|jgi:hypothetical protein|nr:hypothetical protein [Nevskiaceae bacterium]
MGKSNFLIGLAAAAALILAACAAQEEQPAVEAVDLAQTALGIVRDEAAKYLPSDLQGVETSVAALSQQLENGNFEDVLANAPALMTSINSLRDAVTARKAVVDAALAEWGTLNAEVPKMVNLIQTQLDDLSKLTKLPKEMPRATYNSARTGFRDLQAAWKAASTAAEAGDPLGAVAKAKEAQAKANEVLMLLGQAS